MSNMYKSVLTIKLFNKFRLKILKTVPPSTGDRSCSSSQLHGFYGLRNTACSVNLLHWENMIQILIT